MRPNNVDRISSSVKGLKTSFAIVPIGDIPAPELSEAVVALRPVVLLVDDKLDRADRMTQMLDEDGYAVLAEYDAEAALETALLIPPDLAIIDAQLSGSSAVALAISLRERLPDCIVLMVEGDARETKLLGSVKAAHAERQGNEAESNGQPGPRTAVGSRV
jgi:CheY-like chemotaxis protein